VYVLATCVVVVIFTDLVAITTCVSTPNKYLVGGCVGAPIEPFEQIEKLKCGHMLLKKVPEQRLKVEQYFPVVCT